MSEIIKDISMVSYYDRVTIDSPLDMKAVSD